MPIDPSIPLGVKPLQPFDLLRGAQQGAQLKRMAAISAQEEAERQEKDRERAEKDAITNVLRESQGDLAAAIPRIRQINPIMAAGIEKTMTEAKKDALELANLKLVHDEKIVEIGLRDLGGVTDQQTWDFFRAKTAARNPEAPSLQEQYDPATVEEMKVRGLSLKDQIALTKKQYQHVNIDVGGQTQIGAFDPATGQVTPTGVAAPAKSATGGGSDYSDFLTAFAAEKGKPVGKLTVSEHVEARRKYGQADDAARRPLAPIVIMTPQGPMVTTGNDRQTVVPITGPGGTVGNKLSAGLVEKVAGLEGADQLLANVEQLFKPEWVGPIGGYRSQAQLKVPGLDIPEGMADFAAALSAQKNWFIKAITGAQMSEPEAKRIMSQIPDWTNKPELFQANLKASRENAQGLIKEILRLSGAQTTGGTQQQKTTAAPANVTTLLSSKGPGTYTLSDGSKWRKDSSGLTQVK